jgi:methylated-DNA-protein-cysteine methyltransferase-like protein
MNDDFFRRVYRLVARIPRGKVVTYGEIGRMLGRPSGARAVGWAMRQCPEGLPWYRVVNAKGQVSVGARYPDGKLVQQALLEEEGVTFDAAGRLDLDKHAWTAVDDG